MPIGAVVMPELTLTRLRLSLPLRPCRRHALPALHLIFGHMLEHLRRNRLAVEHAFRQGEFGGNLYFFTGIGLAGKADRQNERDHSPSRFFSILPMMETRRLRSFQPI